MAGGGGIRESEGEKARETRAAKSEKTAQNGVARLLSNRFTLSSVGWPPFHFWSSRKQSPTPSFTPPGSSPDSSFGGRHGCPWSWAGRPRCVSSTPEGGRRSPSGTGRVATGTSAREGDPEIKAGALSATACVCGVCLFVYVHLCVYVC